MTSEDLALGISILTGISAAVNVYVGLRMSALYAKTKADSAQLEVTLLKQFVTWKDELLSVINGKYVSATLIAEIRTNVGREMTDLTRRVEMIEERCADRGGPCVRQHGRTE